MSAVRMCDQCGALFSENAEGWGVGTISTNVKDERTGRRQMQQQSADLCPKCNRPASDHITPRLSIVGVGQADMAPSDDRSHVGPHQD